MMTIKEHVPGEDFKTLEYFTTDASSNFADVKSVDDVIKKSLPELFYDKSYQESFKNREEVCAYIILPLKFKEEIELKDAPLLDITFDDQVWLVDDDGKTRILMHYENIPEGLEDKAVKVRLIGFDNMHLNRWSIPAKEGLELIAKEINENYDL